jgi:hypothetical protein
MVQSVDAMRSLLWTQALETSRARLAMRAYVSEHGKVSCKPFSGNDQARIGT